MYAIDDRLAFAPPEPPGLLRAFVLAVIAHLLLVGALTVGLRWQRETPPVVAEAELWSQVPQQAAPKEVPVPPPPPPAPVPVVRAPPLPDPQVQRDAQIALEREKQKREAEERRDQERREAAERRQAELDKERDRKRKLEAQRKKEEELAERKQEQQRLVAEAKRKDEEKKRKQQELEARDSKRLAQIREENMRRMQGMAGGTGAPTSTGTAAQSSGPSASWAGRVVGRVRPNIVFSGTTTTNWVTEVEVRLAPDGTIVSRRVTKRSASPAWDEAVLRALDKTEVLPRDTDGRVPSHGTLIFSPDR